MLIPTACTLTCSFFFFNDTATTEIYTLSLHDALPISNRFNVYRAAQVIGASAPGYSSSQAMAALEEVAKRELPPEISYDWARSEEHTSELQSPCNLVCRLLLEKKKK